MRSAWYGRWLQISLSIPCQAPAGTCSNSVPSKAQHCSSSSAPLLCFHATACLPACLPFSGPSLLLCCPVCLSSQQHTFKLRAHDERDLCSSSSSSSDENLSSLARLQSVQARTGLLSDTGRRLVQTPSRTHQPRKLFQRRAYRRRRLSARRHIATTCRPFFFLRPVASAAAALPPCLSVSSAAHVQTPCTR